MNTFRQIDWNRAWLADSNSQQRGRDRDFWDRRAPSFAAHVQGEEGDEYAAAFLGFMNPGPAWSVLDVGCGPGTLACPLARRARRVTALDFSTVMIGILNERKAQGGLGNLTGIVGSWEDDWKTLGIEVHDAAIASRSMGGDDPHASLVKLMQFASQRVFITCAVGAGPHDPRILAAVGRPAHTNPDYIYIYNLLYQMGISANVQQIARRRSTFANEEEAVDSVRWMLENITPSEEEALRRFVSAELIKEGERWRLKGERLIHWALISWETAGWRERDT